MFNNNKLIKSHRNTSQKYTKRDGERERARDIERQTDIVDIKE